MEKQDKKNRDYKLIIFDVDGTLLDTAEGIINSVKYTIAHMGYRELGKEELYSFVGPRIQDSLQNVYGLHGSELKEAATVFRNYYKKGDVLLATPYNGIYEVLSALRSRGTHLVIATNKRQDFVDELLQKFNLNSYFELVCGTDINGKLTKTDLILKCLNSFFDCTKADAVMIGDSTYDAIAAQNAEVDFIGVTYGYEFKQKQDVDKWKNIGVAHNIVDILQLC